MNGAGYEVGDAVMGVRSGERERGVVWEEGGAAQVEVARGRGGRLILTVVGEEAVAGRAPLSGRLGTDFVGFRG